MNSAAATTDVSSKSRRKSSTKSKTSKQQQPSEVDLEESICSHLFICWHCGLIRLQYPKAYYGGFYFKF